MQTLVQAGIHFLEALAAVLTEGAKTNGSAAPAAALPALVAADARTGKPVLQVPLPSAEALQHGGAALQTILQKLRPGS